MTETVIKGSGNSRSIKSVPNLAQLAPTYDKLLELLTGEGLPVDLGPLNPAGLAQRGTDLNKANLLSDTLCTALSLPTTAVPTEAMDKLRTMAQTAQITASGKCRCEIGSRTGDGATSFTLWFPFSPKVVFIASNTGYNTTCFTAPLIRGAAEAMGPAGANHILSMKLSWLEQSLTISESITNGIGPLNYPGLQYCYVAIG